MKLLQIKFNLSVCLLITWIRVEFANAGSSMESSRFEHVNCKIFRNRVTISGLGYGSTFAQILHFSHSALFSGSGHFAGIFYKCGGYSRTAEELYEKCGKPGGWKYDDPFEGSRRPDPSLSEVGPAMDTLNQYEREGLVDSFNELSDHKLYHWIGLRDEFTPKKNTEVLQDFFRPHLKDPKKQIQFVVQDSAFHLPTLVNGVPCETRNSSLLVGACKYDGPKEMLDHLLSRKTYKVRTPTGLEKVQPLEEFDQTPFFKKLETKKIGLENTGFIYIPSGCQNFRDECHLHVFFHSCFMGIEKARKLIELSGFMEVAEKNNIVILFPLAKESSENPNSCFDGFGYTGTNFANKRGVQVRIMRRMIERFIDYSV